MVFGLFSLFFDKLECTFVVAAGSFVVATTVREESFSSDSTGEGVNPEVEDSTKISGRDGMVSSKKNGAK
jgi:hypothetical protein